MYCVYMDLPETFFYFSHISYNAWKAHMDSKYNTALYKPLSFLTGIKTGI